MNKKPGTIERIKKEKIWRRKEILHAAKTVMLDKNYSGARMDDIASEAGISKPTIYQYFRTKDELLLNLISPIVKSIAEGAEKIRIDLENQMYTEGSKIIHDVFNLYYNSFETDPELFQIFSVFFQMGMIHEIEEESSNILKGWRNKCFDEGYKIASLGMEQGMMKEMDIYNLTDFIWGSFWGIVQVERNKWNENGINRDLKQVLKFSEKLVTNAIVIK